MRSTDPKTGMTLLETDECWRLMAQEEVGRLAVSISDHPDIFPMNHAVDNRTVVFKTEAGTKLAAALLGKAVAYEVDGYDSWTGDAWSVVVKGHAEEIEGRDAVDHVEKLNLQPWSGSPKSRWVRVIADEISGRRFHVIAPEPPGA